MTKRTPRVSAKVAQGEATRLQIMQTAERLFASAGYDGVSLRKIAVESGCRLSLVIYHFASKEGLYQAVFERSILNVLEKRDAELQALVENDRKVSIKAILERLSGPWVELFEEKDTGGALVFARSFVDHSQRIDVIEKFIKHQALLFIAALQKAAPKAPLEEVHRCYHLYVASQVYHILDPARVAGISGKDIADIKKALSFVGTIIAERLESFQTANRRK